MGADWVSQFNRQLCDEIGSLTPTSTVSFVESHLRELNGFSELKCGLDEGLPALARVQHVIALGRTEEDLKAGLVEHLCASAKRITLDYWACYAEVFKGCDPPGSIPDFKLFPHLKEQQFLLLLPPHVEQMLASLQDHRSEVTVMSEENISELRGNGMTSPFGRQVTQ